MLSIEFIIVFSGFVVFCKGVPVSDEVFNPDDLSGKEPDQPLFLSVSNATSTTLLLTWALPEYENGDIRGYRVYFMHGNFTDVRTSASTATTYLLTGLRPYTEYKLWLNAFTYKYEGKSSDPILYRTDVAGPSMPILVNASCQSNASIYLQWIKPTEFSISIDQYNVFFTPTDPLLQHLKGKVTVGTTGLAPYDPLEVVLSDLIPGTDYSVYIIGYTASIYSTGLLLDGEKSDTRLVSVRIPCEVVVEEPAFFFDEFTPGMLITLCVLVGIFIILAFCICCLCRNSESCGRRWRRPGSASGHRDLSPVPMRDFGTHVAAMHADSDHGFSKEYESIVLASTSRPLPATVSSKIENRPMNRYQNILAFDHTLVTLPPHEDGTPGEYINANLIDGFEQRSAYIGTQGPLPNTFNVFWRMIWCQNVHVIVMITNLIERGRKKCEMYWPRGYQTVYGNIQVTMIDEHTYATYTVRTFNICVVPSVVKIEEEVTNNGNGFGESRTVRQFHYTNWPDHGTPDHVLPVLRFVQKSSAANPSGAGPIVVHCSAGVGRTGAYIVLDAMMQMMRRKQKIDVVNFLRHIRTQRAHLVQTEEQYIFIYDALLEAIESGDTNIHQAYLSRYVGQLKGIKDSDKTLPAVQLEQQFKLIVNVQPCDYHYINAKKTVNLVKNCDSDILPFESFRVQLNVIPGEDGSDYINASYFMGYKSMNDFIVAALPCSATYRDFWRMVWDSHIYSIAVMVDFDSEGVDIFWPPAGMCLEGDGWYYRAGPGGVENGSKYQDVFMGSSLEGIPEEFNPENERNVRLFFYPGWPSILNLPISAFIAVNQVVNYNDLNTVPPSPIALIDRHGGVQAATFAALSTLSDQLVNDGFVDVYTCMKLYHMCRPGCWTKSSDLRFIYDAILALSGTLLMTSEPVCQPQFFGLGPNPRVQPHVTIRPISHIRSPTQSNCALDELTTPDVAAVGIARANGVVNSLQNGNAVKDRVIANEATATVQLLPTEDEEGEDDSSSETDAGLMNDILVDPKI